MGFIQKYIKKARNMIHIPGEDVIIIGLDDRNKSIRIHELFVQTGPKFESKMESKVLEGNVAQVFLWRLRQKVDHIFHGEYDPTNPNILHVTFDIDKREGCIFKTDDKPEGIAYLFDMQSGQGAQLVRKTTKDSIFEDTTPETVETTEQAGNDYNFITIPQQIKLKRDPVIELLVSINPYLLGSTIDSVFAGELLRGRVEMWKTIMIALAVGVMAFLVGMGMK